MRIVCKNGKTKKELLGSDNDTRLGTIQFIKRSWSEILADEQPMSILAPSTNRPELR